MSWAPFPAASRPFPLSVAFLAVTAASSGSSSLLPVACHMLQTLRSGTATLKAVQTSAAARA